LGVPRVTLKDVTKVFKSPRRNPIDALADVNLSVEDKECLVLVGPSGSGKTTLLRVVAGLESITSGEISLDGRAITGVPPQQREIAMVFQEPALYPHMSVSENLTFGLQLRGCSGPEIASQLGKVSEMLDLTKLLQARPAEISGGQRQRVALGRALVRRARLVLLDEPFANLDPRWRAQLRQDISTIRENLGTTLIYVTHDHLEAMLTGDRIAVLRDGRLQQFASPEAIYQSPANVFVAAFIGYPPINFFHGLLVFRQDQIFFEANQAPQNSGAPPTSLSHTPPGKVSSGQSELSLALHESWAPVARRLSGRPAILAIRPEHITCVQSAHMEPPTTCLAATVNWKRATGADVYMGARTGRVAFVARAPANGRMPLQNEHLFSFKTEMACLFDPVTGDKIARE
jgi:multiple sugar transport system ATP-binding protein